MKNILQDYLMFILHIIMLIIKQFLLWLSLHLYMTANSFLFMCLVLVCNKEKKHESQSIREEFLKVCVLVPQTLLRGQ